MYSTAIGKLLILLSNHTLMHGGQIQVIRRVWGSRSWRHPCRNQEAGPLRSEDQSPLDVVHLPFSKTTCSVRISAIQETEQAREGLAAHDRTWRSQAAGAECRRN